MNLELRVLRNFVAVAERTSISRAAKIVHLSQPALTRQIQSLEQKLGVTLFERIGKRLVLTAAGDDLLMHASLLLDQAEALVKRASGHERGQIGLIRIGASPQTIAWLLSPVITEFQQLHPNVELLLNEGHNEALIEMVENGAVHVAVAAPVPKHGLVGTPLFNAKLFAVLPPHDRRGSLRTLSLDQLANDKLLVLRRGFLTRQMFDIACGEIGMRPRIMLESDSTHTLLSLANDGHGVAILSSSVGPKRAIEGAVPLVDGRGLIVTPVQAVWNPNRHRPTSAPMIIDLLVKYSTTDAKRRRELSSGAEY